MAIKFTAVSRDAIPAKATRANSASASLLKEFLAAVPAGSDNVAKVDLDEGDKTVESIRSTLQNYVNRHDLPIRLFTSGGNLYMEHLAPEAHEQYKVAQAEKASRRAPRGSKNGKVEDGPEATTEAPVEGEAQADPEVQALLEAEAEVPAEGEAVGAGEF
jgi:hypothetical protein